MEYKIIIKMAKEILEISEKIKIISSDKEKLYKEGSPFLILARGDLLYYLATVSKINHKCEVEKNCQPFFEKDRENLFYHLIKGYRPHEVLFKRRISELKASYQLNYGYDLTANTLVSESSEFLSELIFQNQKLVYAIFSFIISWNNGTRITMIEPDGIVNEISLFVGGSISKGLIEESYNGEQLSRFFENAKDIFLGQIKEDSQIILFEINTKEKTDPKIIEINQLSDAN